MLQAKQPFQTYHYILPGIGKSVVLNTIYPICITLYLEQLNLCFIQIHTFLGAGNKPYFNMTILGTLAQALIDRFDKLINTMGGQDGIPPTPQLASLLNDISNNFQQAIFKALVRIEHDWMEVCKLAFNNSNADFFNCRLISIELLNADTHNGGQAPFKGVIKNILSEELASFVYKPSSVLLDMLVVGDTQSLQRLGLSQSVASCFGTNDVPKSIAETIATEKSDENIATLLILPLRDKNVTYGKLFAYYGYMRYLIADGPEKYKAYDDSTRRRYSRAAGRIAAFAAALGINDIHCENLIIVLGLLYLIDLENSLMSNLPRAARTCLFSLAAGGFYGSLHKEYNKFFYHLEPNPDFYRILPEEFRMGAVEILGRLARKSHELRQWFEHPILDQTFTRVIALPTGQFYEFRRLILWERVLENKSMGEISHGMLEVIGKPDEILHLRKNLTETLSDDGMQSVLLLDPKSKEHILKCCYHGDIPVYYTKLKSTLLLSEEHPIILSGSSTPINYFLHTPCQALSERLSYLANFPSYKLLLLNDLQAELTLLHLRVERDDTRYIQETVCSKQQELAEMIYTTIGNICSLSQECLENTPRNQELLNQLLKLLDTIPYVASTESRQTQIYHKLEGSLVQTVAIISKEDISEMRVIMEDILATLKDAYHRRALQIRQINMISGKIVDTAGDYLLLQKKILIKIYQALPSSILLLNENIDSNEGEGLKDSTDESSHRRFNKP